MTLERTRLRHLSKGGGVTKLTEKDGLTAEDFTALLD